MILASFSANLRSTYLVNFRSLYCGSNNRQAKRAARTAEKKIVQVCRRAAEHVKHDADQATKQFLGELVLGGDMLLTRKVEREFAEYIDRYRRRVAKYPHHPYRFKYPAGDVVQALAIEALRETPEPIPSVPLVGRLPMSLIIIAGTIGIWLTVIRPN